MYQENDIRLLVQKALSDMLIEPATEQQLTMTETVYSDEGIIEDITAVPLQEQFYVPHAADEGSYIAMKQHTPARLGVWRAGTRYKTESLLRFRADHATAQDSVFSDVSDECIKANNLLQGQSKCTDRDEYITRPDLGRLLNDETKQKFKGALQSDSKVLLMVGDGLSSAAVEANISDVIPAIRQGLEAYGIEVGIIPFIKYCRVGAMDDLGELVHADVVCCMIGERPGLVTSESMSAYIAYKPTNGMPESRRTVISNIHKGGTPAVEAGAHIADLIKTMLDRKVSGVELNLKEGK